MAGFVQLISLQNFVRTQYMLKLALSEETNQMGALVVCWDL